MYFFFFVVRQQVYTSQSKERTRAMGCVCVCFVTQQIFKGKVLPRIESIHIILFLAKR